MSMCIDVVLPCLNEADALPTAIGALPAGFTALMADNGIARIAILDADANADAAALRAVRDMARVICR
ncbi:hypothetical protein [Actinomadura sp. DC4]|uniref:hypothetical protein n=1 Tax=Actinomadura sp. DC4 TaxID=3055069 RepID=UPI0025AF7176|nr:hypothetical protein [Actinomadura sp. DC4]MDN3354893.1 hypothetical protein [Actinomadura sp. DC4]